MPTIANISYRTNADLLSGLTTIEFAISTPERLTVRISTTEDALQYIPGFPFRVPEYNALFLYPAYKGKFLQIVQQRDPKQLRDVQLPIYVLSHIFTISSLPELLALIRSEHIDDWEKLKAYMAFSQQNIFANRDVPTSFRLIHEATGLSQEQILQLVRRDSEQIFTVVEDQFLLPVQVIDI